MQLPEQDNQLKLQCRLKSGGHIELTVLDISLCGCMIDRRGWSATAEDRVLLKLPGLSWQPAEVLWVEADKAGLIFEQPLHELVLERFQQALGKVLQAL